MSSHDHRFSAVTVCVTDLLLLVPFDAPMDPDPNILRDCESIGNRLEKAKSIQRLQGAKGRKVGEKKKKALGMRVMAQGKS